jgi:hypothetical protein
MGKLGNKYKSSFFVTSNNNLNLINFIFDQNKWSDVEKAKKMTKELRQEMKNHPLRSLTLPKTLQLEAVKQLISCAPNLVSLDISSLTDVLNQK